MATYYVDNVTGNNGNSGDAAHPWKTITYAVTKVTAGDTIKIVPTATQYSDYFTVTDVNGTAGNPITITSSTTSRPEISADSLWLIQSDYWTFDLLDFRDYGAWQIQLGGSPAYGTNNKFANHITISNCYFRHGNKEGIQIAHATDVTISNCLFRDLRSRIAGADICALNIYGGGDITISGCDFEDIGSDGVHIGCKYHQIDAVTIQNCDFWVNRPYGSEVWQDFSTNVGENGLDVKSYWSNPATDPVLVGPVLIDGCTIAGFYATVAGQDASGSNGEAIGVHMNATPVTITNTMISDCAVGVGGSNGPYGGTTYDFHMSDCVITNTDTGILLYNGDSIEIRRTYISATLGLEVHEVDILFENNIVNASSHYRSNTGYTETFTNNCWLGATPPVQWQDAGDVNVLPTVKLHHLQMQGIA